MQKLIIIAGLLSYPAVTHLLIIFHTEQYALMALMVLCAVSLVLKWYADRQVRLKGAGIYLLVLAVGTLNLFTHSAHAVSVPFIIVNLMLAVFVLDSMKHGSVSIFERLLTVVHGENIHPEARKKARLITAVWGWYFAVICLMSLLLALFAPLAWWSWFSNVGYFIFTPVVIVMMHMYQVSVFGKYNAAIHMSDMFQVFRMPLSDKRHPLYGFMRGQR